MSDVTIYGVRGSRTARVLWMAAELGLEVNHVAVNWDQEAGSPAHLARNPNGRVPVLDDAGLVLFESMAINLHLAGTRGGPLAAVDSREEALMLQWSFWVMSECERDMERVMGASARDEAEARDRAIARLVRPLDALETVLLEQPYLVGRRFTVADLNVASVFAWGRNGDFPFERWPSAKAWLERCFDRPCLIVDGDPGRWS